MKRMVWIRCLLGAGLGISISTVIAIVVSAMLGDGNYYAVHPQLIQDAGSELTAVVLQTVVSVLYGAAWGGASVIWEREDWGLTRQTLTHLVICSLATFPVAYLVRWMDRNVMGVVSYFAIFLAVYAGVWVFQFSRMKRRIACINRCMQQWGSGAE